MNILLVTDAWLPQVSGVVSTLVQLVRELERAGHGVAVMHPGVEPAQRPAKALAAMVQAAQPDAIHLATEGPLGWAARRYCRKHKLAFTSGYHSRWPEMLRDRYRLPLGWGYAVLRYFHGASCGVMVSTSSRLGELHARGFRRLRSWTHGVDTQAFAYQESAQVYPPLGALAHPVSLYVGRVAPEKNIESFLKLDVPGTKVVCGTGPLEKDLRERYPTARWLGVLPRDELARVYAAADVLVMPGRGETVGQVMLEAMACGTPVAAYPVAAPREVLGAPPRGGVTHNDLQQAWYGALSVPRHEARNRALQFGWAYAVLMFIGHLVPARAGVRLQRGTSSVTNVTNMSSEASKI